MNNPFADEKPPSLLTVSQLNRQAKSLLEGHFGFVWVEGEISNFARPSSGHWYFSLKDGGAQVRCAMFRNRNQRIRFTPQNGDAIKLRCRVSLFEGRGEFQLIVEHLEQAGAGALQAAFEKLKNSLLAEGLFDQQHKQTLPTSVSHLGVITSPTGAAIHDILTVLQRRCPAIAVSLLPVAVQGLEAAGQIAAAIDRANRWQREGKVHLDALIVGRGGGSLEDLWAFNEERVARAIAASDLPIISAVGHEVDFSIADMVADVRAATPSAAAELLSPDQHAWLQRLHTAEERLTGLALRKLESGRTHLLHLQRRLQHPGAQLREQAQRMDNLEQRLIQSQKNVLLQKRAKIALLTHQLLAQSPRPRVKQAGAELRTRRENLTTAMEHRLQRCSTELAHLAHVLDSLSPLATLQRGYAIVTASDGAVVNSAGALAIGDKITARVAQGRLGLIVDEIDELG